MDIRIIRISNGLWINPTPLYIEEYLRYQHRSIEKGKNKFTLTLLHAIHSDGGVITLPGFYKKILNLIQDHGDTAFVEDYRVKMPPIDWVRVKQIGWREYQLTVIANYLFGALEENGLFHATGGYGKTYMQAAAYAAWHTLNTILVVPTLAIAQQTTKKFKELFPEKHVGCVYTGVCDISQDITITTLDSLEKCAIEKCQFLLADEIQCCSRVSFQQAYNQMNPIRILGYTATSKWLFNNADKLLKGLFGENLIEISYQQAQAIGAVVPVIVYFVELPLKDMKMEECCLPDDIVKKMNKGIDLNTTRNKLIGEVCSLVPNQRQTIVFLDHLQGHLIEVMKYMPQSTKFLHRETSKTKLGVYALSSKEQEKIKKAYMANEFQFLVASDAFRAGVDVQNCSVLVQAAGGSSYVEVIQEALRGSRTLSAESQERLGVGEKTHLNIIDFQDNHDQALESMAEKREKYYREQGWEIRKVKSVKDIDWSYTKQLELKL